MPFDIDRSLKKFISSSSSKSFHNMGKGSNYFSSGGLSVPFPNTFQQRPQQKFPEIHYNTAKKVVLDGKPVYYAGSKQNAPPPHIVQKVYARIPDDKNVPVIFQTKKQYLQEYIKNQEIANDVKFSKREKEQYIKKELKEMKPVVSRFTTYHNDFMPPRTVFFTDNKFHKDNGNFEVSALHEYWHEKTEGIKHLQDDEVKAEQYARDKAIMDKQSRNMVFKHQYGFYEPQSRNVKTVLINPEDFLETTYEESQLRSGSPYQSYEEYKKQVLFPKVVEEKKRLIQSPTEEVAIPYLNFDKWGRPTGHEGRNTSQAAVELGLKEIPVMIEQKRGSYPEEKPPRPWQHVSSYKVKKFLNSPAYKEQYEQEKFLYKGDYGINEDEVEKEKKEYWEKDERERLERRRESEKRLAEIEAERKALEDSYSPEQKVQFMLIQQEIEDKIKNKDISKDKNQIYLSPKNLPKPKNEQEKDWKNFLVEREKEKNKKFINEPYVFHSPYTKDVTFLGKWPPNIDFDKDENIRHLSNVLTHEEIHSVLEEQFPREEYDEEQSASDKLDNISLPRHFITNNEETKAVIMNPLSASTINFPLTKITSNINHPDYQNAIIIGEVLQRIEDKKQSKDRLNKMQKERLKNVSIAYTHIPSKGMNNPYEEVPDSEPVMMSHISKKPESIYQATLRNRAMNILKRYPSLITEAEENPAQLVFYEGPKKAAHKGILWATLESNEENPATAMVDVSHRHNYPERRMRDQVIARGAFHELRHGQQFAENPVEYEKRRIEAENQNIRHFEQTDEIDAELYSVKKVAEVDKNLKGDYLSYLSPEDTRRLLHDDTMTKEEEKEIYNKVKPARLISELELRDNTLAGLEMLDKSTDRKYPPNKIEVVEEKDSSLDKSLPIKEDWNNQQLRKNRGYVDLVQINAQKFKEEFEKEQQTKLAWNKSRSESIANVEIFDAHPQINFNSLLDVNDGRHRINRAAEQGDDIVVAVKGPEIVKKLLSRGILSEDQSDVKYIDYNDESNDRLYSVKVNGEPYLHPEGKLIETLPNGVEVREGTGHGMYSLDDNTRLIDELRFRTEPEYRNGMPSPRIALSGVSTEEEFTDVISSKKRNYENWVRAIKFAKDTENLSDDTGIYTWQQHSYNRYPMMRIKDLDISKDRLNYLQMQRLKNIDAGYITTKSITPKPFQYLPNENNDDKIPLKYFEEQTSTPLEKTIRNKALNIIRKYPMLLGEMERSPATTMFYYGPGKSSVAGQYWPPPDKKTITNTSEGPGGVAFVDVNEKQYRNYLGKQRKALIASTVLHEARHAQQFEENPEGFRQEREQYLSEKTPWVQQQQEYDADKYAQLKMAEIIKGQTALRAYATPEEAFNIMRQDITKEEYKKIEDELKKRREDYYYQTEANKTAGIQMLDMNNENNSTEIIVDESKDRHKKHPQDAELQKQAVALLSMSDKELVPDIGTHDFPPTDAQIRQRQRKNEYSKAVKAGLIKPFTTAEAIAAGMTIEQLNEAIKESKNQYPSGHAIFIRDNPDKIPIMRKAILERDQGKNREEYSNEELKRRSDEFRRKKQLENEQYNKALQQLPPTATTDDKVYEILRLSAEMNKLDVVDRERIIRNMENAIKNNPLTGIVFQGTESGIKAKPINIFEDEERNVAKELQFSMENFMIEEEAKEQLSKLLFNEEYYHNLKPNQKRRILYLIRKQAAPV